MISAVTGTECQSFASFPVMGLNQTVCSSSQITSENVNFEAGLVNLENFPPGSSQVLIYEATVDGHRKCFTVIVNRQADTPRFSATCGNILIPEALTDLTVQCPDGMSSLNFPSPFLPFGPTGATGATGPLTGTFNYAISGFDPIYSEPAGQLEGGMTWIAPVTGDYDIDIVISYETLNASLFGLIISPETSYDNFVAILRRPDSIGGTIVAVAPVIYTPIFVNGVIEYALARSGQAVFNLGLRLLRGDSLTIYLVSNLNGVTPVDSDTQYTVEEIYSINPLGTTFNTHLLSCNTELL